jgi:acetoacetyl-CoA synthetase
MISMNNPGDVARPLWTPDEPRRSGSRLGRYLSKHGFTDYDAAWQWSIAPGSAGDFWHSVADEFDVRWHSLPQFDLIHAGASVSEARWFGGSRLNYAENALRPPPTGPATLAVMGRSQTRPDVDLTWSELQALVARVRRGLLAAGVRVGDRVAGYLPNIPEATAAMLAAASLGAIWTSCAPETGVAGVLDRLAQVEPVVLLGVDGYRYGGRAIDRTEQNESVRAALPALRQAVWIAYLEPERPAPPGWTDWGAFTAEIGPLEFEPLEFDHPLYVLYSSGTTGQPKAIVHRHGGILLEHAKALGWHFDLGPGDLFFWFTTTGWMMWNFCMSGLLVGATVVCFDGDPAWPRPDALWGLMAETGTTCGGVGSGYLVAGMKAGFRPGRDHRLGRLRTLGATGSPLPAAAAQWVYEEVSSDVLLASFSGGTDVCTGFVGPSPLHPVWAGEISCRCLGAAVEVFADGGHPITGREGELVLTAPLPSMPVGFWGDKDGTRYREAYFSRFPGVWAHGDRATLTDRGTVIITGRSDGTLNRGGVRMGTAEFYAVVERFGEVTDSLVVHVEDPGGGPGELWLFVVAEADDGLPARVQGALRRDLSPRHVPDHIVNVPAIPRTLSGKKLEVPVKRILGGVPANQALTLASLANPESLDPFITLAQELAQQAAASPGFARSAGEERGDGD